MTEEITSAEPGEEIEMPDVPELFITPFGTQMHKVGTPDGKRFVLLKALTPGMTYTIRYTDEQFQEIAKGAYGGVQPATLADLAAMKGT